MNQFSLTSAVIGAVVALAVGCAQSGTSETDTTSTPTAATNTSAEATGAAPATEAAATITISEMAFGDPVTVAPGAVVGVTNNDGVEHSVTAEEGDAFSVDVDGNASGTFTAPDAPGEYPFLCTYHPSMTGMLIVA